mmetsp:Transcript_71454/g.225660  ORF Transcript_71454/g.225660 Transcript_71454/m.225660 type:complete len:310 (-) Transcript_71454:76-1005(-)
MNRRWVHTARGLNTPTLDAHYTKLVVHFTGEDLEAARSSLPHLPASVTDVDIATALVVAMRGMPPSHLDSTTGIAIPPAHLRPLLTFQLNLREYIPGTENIAGNLAWFSDLQDVYGITLDESAPPPPRRRVLRDETVENGGGGGEHLMSVSTFIHNVSRTRAKASDAFSSQLSRALASGAGSLLTVANSLTRPSVIVNNFASYKSSFDFFAFCAPATFNGLPEVCNAPLRSRRVLAKPCDIALAGVPRAAHVFPMLGGENAPWAAGHWARLRTHRNWVVQLCPAIVGQINVGLCVSVQAGGVGAFKDSP